MNKKTFILSAAAVTTTAVAASSLIVSKPANAKEREVEKCFGVVKAGKNDCATGKHQCAGHADKDRASDEWVFVPEGVCARLAGSETKDIDKVISFEEGSEKCFGVVKAGKNDCGASDHSCAGQATTDRAVDEWLTLPKGLCEKLAANTIADEAGEAAGKAVKDVMKKTTDKVTN